MLVSIIIPNYNHSLFLIKRIDSVLSQTYNSFEIIILDDCSADNSREIIELYRNHPKVSQIIYNEANSGSTFKQWRKGIALAKGRYIWIAESDDYCEPGMLEVLVRYIQQCEDAVLSFCQSYEVDEYDNILGDLTHHTDAVNAMHWKEDYCNNGIDEISNYLLYRNTIPNASAVLFKKDAYLKADKSFERMKFAGDWMLWVQLLKHGNIVYSSQPLNRFRKHSATTRVLSTFVKQKRRIEEEYDIVLDIKSTIPTIDKNIVQNKLREVEIRFTNCFTKWKILKQILNPFSYSSNIPLTTLLKSYLKHKMTFSKA